MPWLIAFLINNAVPIGAIAGIVTIVHESAETVKVVKELKEKPKEDK